MTSSQKTDKMTRTLACTELFFYCTVQFLKLHRNVMSVGHNGQTEDLPLEYSSITVLLTDI
jgi:hypothetical protein